MSIILNQLKCVFDGHKASPAEVARLNNEDYNTIDNESVKEIISKCERCNYPIKLRKYTSSPDKYKIIEL